MATNAWNKLQQIGVEIAIVLFMVGAVWTGINPIFLNGVDEAITVANAENYTATKGALNTWKDAGRFAIGLLMLSAAVYTIIQLFTGRGRQVSLLDISVSMMVFFIVAAILLFQTAIPSLIKSKATDDATLASILNIIYVAVILASVGILIKAVQDYRKPGSRKRQEATISIFGR